MATKRASQNLKDAISEIAEKITCIHNKAITAYTPIVNDICNRTATENEVDQLLTNLFNFIGEQRMFELFKQVCRAYLDTYPEVIGYYIIEYFKNYDIEKAKALSIEIPSYMEDENTNENL